MILIPIFLILSFIFPPYLHEVLSMKLATPFHNFCLSYIDYGKNFNFIYQSLICGKSLEKNSFYESLKLLGLLHLMVISGMHILFLEKILSKILFLFSPFQTLKRGLILLFLALYALIGLLKPPIVRALLSLCLSFLNQKYKFHWPRHQRVFITGALCLMIFPSWWSSYSLILSWAGSLALSLSKNVKKELFCFVLLYPLLLPLAPQSPVSLFSNWIFAPFLTSFLFPLTLFGTLFPFLREFTDSIWQSIESFFHFFTLSLPPLSEGMEVPMAFSWSYLALLQFVIYFWKIYEKRNSK